MNNTTYVLVAVTGVEDETAAIAAIENLSNDDQEFDCIGHASGNTPFYDDDPVIYFP